MHAVTKIEVKEVIEKPTVTICYVFFSLAPQSSSSLLTRLPRTPPHPIVLVSPLPQPVLLAQILTPCSLRQHLPFPCLPPTPLNTELLRSMDLPWISPGSPLHLTDTRLRVFPCFPSRTSLVSPSSPHPCFSVTLYHFYL